MSASKREPILELAEAFTLIRDAEEARAFLTDLCTPSELNSLAERWEVAKLLAAGGHTYRQIHDLTGVSTTTIVRVARFLNEDRAGGYRTLFERVQKEDV
ncbi:YerC/YecD family TrpR-related protein [Sphingomicrobium sediminis]|uniref:YerC/YecD family TrpR-related protein n=1 Tax=Sphingomicrobium sediminis TaxID=2950949 RepID=A0A9X2EID3_9SPHN|nr:YerC/YecD family TrpR-related protein [Sphingomicrobium sediminis]MCM8558051.1 YerC/YecD family TrpR-related protein [Sphingomicrobium sediminis]